MLMKFLYMPAVMTWADMIMITAAAAIVACCVNSGFMMVAMLAGRDEHPGQKL